MTREDIEKAANDFHGGIDFWTSKVVIDFALEQVNAALEEAAELNKHRIPTIATEIRAMKVKP